MSGCEPCGCDPDFVGTEIGQPLVGWVCAQHREEAMKDTVPAYTQELARPTNPSPVVRVFDTGANRDVDSSKYDYEGFLSPLVIERFGEYMHANRLLRDGSVRDSDNWQKGIPKNVYMKSMWRHFLEVWMFHRRPTTGPEFNRHVIEGLFCALMFNVMGYLHELLKERV